MEFQPEKTDEFLELFEGVKNKIAAFPGCVHLELCQDPHLPHIFFTLSHWNGLEDLEAYRASPLFEGTWEKTKKLFAAKPRAYSLKPVMKV
jgi:hypothetical protein